MKAFLPLVFAFFSFPLLAQHDDLPVELTPSELEQIQHETFSYGASRGIETPPPFDNLRAMAEWEELQALTIAWISYPTILKKIVKAAKEETRVIILSENPENTENYLMSNTGGPALDNLDNVTILEGDYDSVWMRDYAGNPVYGNEVDDLVMVDWIYNRPTRPNDDASPQLIADELGLELYCITAPPADLVNTGGNFMVDGFGTAFASELILDENDPNNPYDVTPKSESEIDEIMLDYLGLERYIKMNVLPYDEIHHIDMHMKLIDEETILVGLFPEGVADGPQINANIEYVLSNFNSKWGTPYKIIYLPMPPSTNEQWADEGAAYRTYTNSVFVNNTLIVPTYREEYDTVALSILEDALPGYNIVPIDCDNEPDPIIFASGAIHCITHAVGVADPLLISHQPLPDTEDNVNSYIVNAYMKHRDGIASGTLFYKTDLASDYTEIVMSDAGNDIWTAAIPAQEWGTTVYYYVRGAATTGKVQVRPMPAPEGYWEFDVISEIVSVDQPAGFEFGNVFPNPANSITCIPVTFEDFTTGELVLIDITGRETAVIYNGTFKPGTTKFFLDASMYAPGAYRLAIRTAGGMVSQGVMIR